MGKLFLVVFLSWQKPILIAVFIIAFAVYWLFKIIYLSFHQIAGYRQMRKHLKIDWLEKLKKLKTKNWQNIHHLVILPTYFNCLWLFSGFRRSDQALSGKTSRFLGNREDS